MRYLVWVLRLVVFLVVLLFALKNTDPVKVTFFADYTLNRVPLIIVMLVAFLLGLLLGLLLMMMSLMRQKRVVARLRRDTERLEDSVERYKAEKADADLSTVSTTTASLVSPQ